MDLFYLVLASPSKGLQEVVRRRPIGWALILITVYALINALVWRWTASSIFERLGVEAGVTTTPIAVAFSVAGWVFTFVTVGVWHIAAKTLGGKGSYLGLLCGIAFASLPSIFFGPLLLIASLLGAIGLFLSSLGNLAITLWVLVLTVLALRHNYLFSTLRAILALLLPVIVVVLLVLAIVLLVFVSLGL